MYGANGTREIEVYLNVYDLNTSINPTLYNIGLGLYHSGIQIQLREYTFGAHAGDTSGVMQVTPKTNHPNHRESILLGVTNYTFRDIQNVLDGLRESFPGNSYHLVRKNCNTFTNCFSQAILHKPIPGWVNRMANLGKTFLQIDDFFRMRPYEQKWETSANELGVALEQKKDVFSKGSGVSIG